LMKSQQYHWHSSKKWLRRPKEDCDPREKMEKRRDPKQDRRENAKVMIR